MHKAGIRQIIVQKKILAKNPGFSRDDKPVRRSPEVKSGEMSYCLRNNLHRSKKRNTRSLWFGEPSRIPAMRLLRTRALCRDGHPTYPAQRNRDRTGNSGWSRERERFLHRRVTGLNLHAPWSSPGSHP